MWKNCRRIVKVTFKWLTILSGYKNRIIWNIRIVWICTKICIKFLVSGQTPGREHSPTHQQKIGLKIYWAWPGPPEQDLVLPTASPSHQEASTSLLSSSIKGQTEWKAQSQKTTQTDHMDHNCVQLSETVSHAVSGHPIQMDHGGEFWQNLVHRRRKWQTTAAFLPWEPHQQYEQAKR